MIYVNDFKIRDIIDNDVRKHFKTKSNTSNFLTTIVNDYVLSWFESIKCNTEESIF